MKYCHHQVVLTGMMFVTLTRHDLRRSGEFLTKKEGGDERTRVILA
jgi:hypothetical protein